MRNETGNTLAKPGLKLWVVVGILVLLGLFYFIFDPVESGFMPQCVFHHLTGLQCMGCGSQRMAHALLHGDIAGALRANALVTLSLPVIFFLLWLEIFREKYNRLYARIYSRATIWGVAIILLLWFIARNIAGI